MSRFPVHLIRESTNDLDFSRSAYTFPLAGLLIALPAGLFIFVGSNFGLDPIIVALLALSIQLFATGALHEDGLADTVDGFWGGATRERKLEIMRDSTTGTYGVLALIMTIALRTAFLTTLLAKLDPITTIAIFMAFESLSRAALLPIWVWLPPARPAQDTHKAESGKQESGLSARFGTPLPKNLYWAGALCLPAFMLILFAGGLIAMLLALLLAGLTIQVMYHLAKNHIGGHTGDVLGATQQLSLLGLYLGIALAI